MVESREAKNMEDLEFIVEILIAFFSLEANAIDLRLMASTIIGFTTEKNKLSVEFSPTGPAKPSNPTPRTVFLHSHLHPPSD